MASLLIHVWRQFAFAALADIAAAVWFGDNGTINLLTFAGAFVFAGAVYLLGWWWRAKRGLKPLGWWQLTAWAVVFCALPGAALGSAFLEGKHWPSGSRAKVPSGPAKPPHPHRTVPEEDGAAFDSDVLFTLFGIARTPSVQTTVGRPLTPVAGDALVAVDMLVAAKDEPAEPFARPGSARC
jgi:hypothetical protein